MVAMSHTKFYVSNGELSMLRCERNCLDQARRSLAENWLGAVAVLIWVRLSLIIAQTRKIPTDVLFGWPVSSIAYCDLETTFGSYCSGAVRRFRRSSQSQSMLK